MAIETPRLDYGTPDSDPQQRQRRRLDRIDIAIVTSVLVLAAILIVVLAAIFSIRRNGI